MMRAWQPASFILCHHKEPCLDHLNTYFSAGMLDRPLGTHENVGSKVHLKLLLCKNKIVFSSCRVSPCALLQGCYSAAASFQRNQEVKVKKTKIKGAATVKNYSQGVKQYKAGCIDHGDKEGGDKRCVGK